MTKEVYCLFAWDNHEARGGMHDMIGVYPDIETAKAAFPDKFEDGHIVQWQDGQPVILYQRGHILGTDEKLWPKWMTPEERATESWEASMGY